MAEEHELIKKHANEAIQALVPLLDNEKTRHIGHVLLKAIDLGLGMLSADAKGESSGANNQIRVSGASPPGTVPQNFQKDIEQENKVQGLVDETLKELEMMDNHESNPITTDKDGNEIEYVKGMLCNCQFASEFHKYCDNQCKETLIKAEGDPKEYIKFIDKERKEQDTKSLDEAMDEVTGFIDTELGIGVSPRPKPQQSQQQAPQNDAQQETPLNEENKQFALDPSQPVVMPGEPTGLENDSS